MIGLAPSPATSKAPRIATDKSSSGPSQRMPNGSFNLDSISFVRVITPCREFLGIQGFPSESISPARILELEIGLPS